MKTTKQDFKTQQELWQYLIDGGKVRYKEWDDRESLSLINGNLCTNGLTSQCITTSNYYDWHKVDNDL